MATLAEVREALFPEAVPVTGESGRLGLEVGWVRVLRARVPALDVLDPGDLVIVPAAALPVVAPTVEQLRDLAASLARAGAAGLLLLPGGQAGPATRADVAGRAPKRVADLEAARTASGPGATDAATASPAAAGPEMDALAVAAGDAGLPAFRLAPAEPAGLERRIIGYLVDRRGELERAAAGLERDLARLAMAGRGLDALAAAIGGFLRRAVAIEGSRGDPLAIHAPSGIPDAAASVAAYLARPTGVGRRVSLPGGPGESAPVGRLVLLGDRPGTELDAIATERIAPLLSLELVLEAQVRRARDEASRVDVLPSAGPPWVVLVARQAGTDGDGSLGPPAAADGRHGAAGPEAEHAREPRSREDVRRELRLRYPARQLALRGTSESVELRMVAAVDPDDRDGSRVAGRIAGFLGRPVGVSRPFTDPARRPAEEAAARAALEAAERLPSPPAVARAERVPAYRLLATLGNLPEGRAQAFALLEPILAGRQTLVRDRLATLRAVLDRPGIGEAALALGVHRNTLAYRLRAIEAATGWDLHDPELRLALAVALRVVQSA